jgi:hypothetical protein
VLDSDNEVSSWALAMYRNELKNTDDISCALCDVISIMLVRKQTLTYTLKYNYRELIIGNYFPYNDFLREQDVIDATIAQLRTIDAFYLQSCSALKKKLTQPL